MISILKKKNINTNQDSNRLLSTGDATEETPTHYNHSAKLTTLQHMWQWAAFKCFHVWCHIWLYTANRWLLYDTTEEIALVSACAGGSTSHLTPKKTFLAIFQKRWPVFGQCRQNPIPFGTDRNTPQDFVLWLYAMLSEDSRGIPNGCVLAHKNLKQGVKEMPEISTIALVITLPT